MTRLAGYDLNGWRDLAWRNWTEAMGEDAEAGRESVVSGGLGGTTVALGTDEHGPEPHVGGVQALLAPHGRGGGWGELGAPWRRLAVRAALSALGTGSEAPVRAIAAALGAMAAAPRVGVLAIPDTGTMDETAREALLDAMRLAGIRRRLLVWRPVLAVLGTLDQGLPDRSRIGVVSHVEDGLCTQTLTLREGAVRAPERRAHGRFHPCGLGLDGLARRAGAALRAVAPASLKDDDLAAAGVAERLALGERVEAMPVRCPNGNWVLLAPDVDRPALEDRVPPDLVHDLEGCDVVLLDTPADGTVAADLRVMLESALGHTILRLDADRVAYGALVAARRLHRGQPVYFDFLPRIATIVEGAERPESHDLIDADALLPAGTIYRSPRPARFALQPNQDRIEVYLSREGDRRPRRADVALGAPVRRPTPVSLTVEQQPAAGRARLRLEADDASLTDRVDWETAEPLETTWEALLESLERPRPTVPDRHVLPGSAAIWQGVAGGTGFADLLERNLDRERPNWDELAGAAASRLEGRHALGSDGDVPEEVSERHVAMLDALLGRAEAEVLSRLARGRNPDNHPLRFATWTFRRCPRGLIAPMLDALDARGRGHPLIHGGGSWSLVYQGLGRVAFEADEARPVLRHLLSLPPTRWRKDQKACAAHLLSRVEEAAAMLGRADVDLLASIARRTLREEIGGRYTATFIYAPAMLAGLLRYRLVEPYALVRGEDPVVEELMDPLDAVVADLDRRKVREPRLERHHAVLEEVREALEGHGQHSNLLARIYDLDT